MGNDSEHISPSQYEYAAHISELRRSLRLSQRAFAARLDLKRGTVAQWEGAVREPLSKNYRALAELAKCAGSEGAAAFFLSMASRAERPDEVAYLRTAALARDGDRVARRLLSLCTMTDAGLGRLEADRIVRARRGKGSKLLALFDKVANEIQYVRILRAGRKLATARRARPRTGG